MVGLHMLDDQIIQRASTERVGNIFEELAADRIIRRIHQHSLFIQQHIAVVGHPARDGKQIFKTAQAAVAAANINQVFGNLSGTVHRTTPPQIIFCTNCIIFSQTRLPWPDTCHHKKPAVKTAGF